MLPASEYYDAVAKDYYKHYESDLLDPTIPYPANHFRLEMLKKSFAGRKRVIDIGCGDGHPLSQLPAEYKVGIDISPAMVAEAKKRLDNVYLAGIDNVADVLVSHDFDGLVCTGVMPHIEDERKAITKMYHLLAPGGKIFIEFRNELFNLFTFNRLSVDFVVNRLVDEKYKEQTRKALSARLNMDVPPVRPYDKMLAKYHNPIEMCELMEEIGFEDLNILWYHYHPTLPWLEFERQDAIALEGKPSWKSMFTCSAFVIEGYRA